MLTLPPSLKRFNLVGATKPARRRLVMTGEGGPGTGKTDFFYRTFPRPALVIQLDLNDEGIRERYEGRDIFFKDIIVPPFIVHDEDQRAKDMIIAMLVRDLYKESVNLDCFRSIMIDEGKALYTLARRAFLLNLDFGGSSQQSYAPINAYMARFFTLAKQHRLNLYISHRQEDERESGYSNSGKRTSIPTGNKQIAGWKDALYESQCHVLFTKDEKYKGKIPSAKFDMRVLKCTANTSVEGFTFNGDDITLANLGQMIWPTSEESDWV